MNSNTKPAAAAAAKPTKVVLTKEQRKEMRKAKRAKEQTQIAASLGDIGAAVFMAAFPTTDRVALLAALNGTTSPDAVANLTKRVEALKARLDRARAALSAATNAPKVIADTKARVEAVVKGMQLNRS
jgi:hypothetical protein